MIYRCESYNDSDGTKEEWTCQIKKIINSNKCCELVIESRDSTLHIIIGKAEIGNFICIPEHSFGCFLAKFRDIRWNANRLEKDLGIVDAVTIAKGLYKLHDKGLI